MGTSLTGKTITTPPALWGRSEFVVAGGTLYCVLRATGAVAWSFTPADGPASGVPVIANYVVSVAVPSANEVIGLDTHSGSVLWTFHAGGHVNSNPITHKATVFFGADDGKVYAVDMFTGNLVWSALTGGPVQTSPACRFNTVCVSSSDGNVYAFNRLNGNIQWVSRVVGAGSPSRTTS